MEGIEFLRRKYNLGKSEEGVRADKREKARTGISTKNQEKRIELYLNRFKELRDRNDPKHRERGHKALKKVLHRDFVMQPEDVPESYFKDLEERERQAGHGAVTFSKERRKELAETVSNDQRNSLNLWIDYFLSPEAYHYPDYLIYTAFRSIVTLGAYNHETQRFNKRSKKTTAPFPELNREAFALAIERLKERYQGDHEGQHLQELFREDFGVLYAQNLQEVTITISNEILEITEGTWITYEQGSDPHLVTTTLKEKNTGWCLAGEETTKSYLHDGDLHIYYSNDQNGNPTIPRLAIHEKNNKITQVRGIAEQQNIDSYIQLILDTELNNLGNKGREYQKANSDMKQLTAIETKNNNNETLTSEDLRFLYEVDQKVTGFGYSKDPRIKEIHKTRNIKQDLATVTGYAEHEISLTKEEVLSGNFRYHHGDLDLSNHTSTEGLILPEEINGNLNLSGLTSAEGLELPKKIDGDLDLSGLTSAKGLKLPEEIGGSLYLNGLTSAKGLELLKKISGTLDLSRLTSSRGS